MTTSPEPPQIASEPRVAEVSEAQRSDAHRRAMLAAHAPGDASSPKARMIVWAIIAVLGVGIIALGATFGGIPGALIGVFIAVIVTAIGAIPILFASASHKRTFDHDAAEAERARIEAEWADKQSAADPSERVS